MPKFKKVAIIGVGLIGGSIGLALKKKHSASKVVGVFHRQITLKSALKCKAIDAGVMDVASGARDADIIVLASPVHLIPDLAAEVLKHAKPGAVVTDVGSTKEWIVTKVEKIFKNSPNVRFVGSHPMAGSEHAGVEFASGDLFEGSPCIVTRTPKTNSNALNKVVGFWKSIGLKVKVMTPREHDRTVSLISHLPHVVAFALAGAVPGKEMECAAEGFRDTTRVASSDPDLWADIFLTNRKPILDAGTLFSKQCADLLKAIAKDDRHALVKILTNSRAKRKKYLNAK